MSLLVNKLRMRLKAEHQMEKCGQRHNLDFLLIFKQMTLTNQETGYRIKKKKKKPSNGGTSLAVQWLRLASTAEDTDLTPGLEAKIPHARQCGKRINK